MSKRKSKESMNIDTLIDYFKTDPKTPKVRHRKLNVKEMSGFEIKTQNYQ